MSRDPGLVPADPRFSTPSRPETPHSLHPRRGQPAVPGPARAGPKPDRLLVGLLAGVALFYLLGQALGLGRHRTNHANPRR